MTSLPGRVRHPEGVMAEHSPTPPLASPSTPSADAQRARRLRTIARRCRDLAADVPNSSEALDFSILARDYDDRAASLGRPAQSAR
jgi:hypothetical protein